MGVATRPIDAGRRLAAATRFRLRASGVEAVVRVVGWAIVTGLDRLWTAGRSLGATPEARREARAAFARRAGDRAVQLLGTLKGPFAKAGQFAAVRHDVIPPEAAKSLVRLRDRVPPLPLAALAPVLAEALGPAARARIVDIEPTPLGAASIAQAHRARLDDGRRVVIKIQYPWIAAALESDLRLLRRLTGWLARARGVKASAGGVAASAGGVKESARGVAATVDVDRLFDEFAAGLRDELDFEREARAASEIAANLEDIPGVVVPAIVPELSGRRVLTMQHHACVRIDDRAALSRLGVRPAAVLEILARAYAKQVFVDGLFHADPHPGNLFVLDTPTAAERPEVLFVDFGLCRRLEPALRSALRQGIYAVLQRDLDAFVGHMQALGMIAPGAEAGVRDAVEAMFTRLAEAGGGRGMLGASSGAVIALKDEAKRLLQETPGVQLPNDLLLYAKTLSYLFALGDELDPEVDLMKIALPYLLRFLATKD